MKPSARRTEMLAIVDRYSKSGMSRKEFCQNHGIPISTLQWWLSVQRKNTTPQSQNPPFIQLKPRAASMKSDNTQAVVTEGVIPCTIIHGTFTIRQLLTVLAKTGSPLC